MDHIIGLDIGGANIKAAHSSGECCSQAFPLWKSPGKLAETLVNLIDDPDEMQDLKKRYYEQKRKEQIARDKERTQMQNIQAAQGGNMPPSQGPRFTGGGFSLGA